MINGMRMRMRIRIRNSMCAVANSISINGSISDSDGAKVGSDKRQNKFLFGGNFLHWCIMRTTMIHNNTMWSGKNKRNRGL
ncbi:hypothetical protein TSUD_146050 [Trifolium subterraneum]|uniref:Uncharacterized protein n=1 Tax=Trifolium subterraneum TaxID=3900 RepID=A0A2Z6P6Q3_TRISU|nr:hypothetical protein TSUD_146050 [Trifolium subterraneum]